MTDDTELFQTLLDKSHYLDVPPGSWVISKTLNVPTGARINLNGEIMLADKANCTMLHLVGNDILIRGNGTLNGNSANQTKIVAGIDCERVNRIRLNGFTITNIHGWPVNFTSISCDIKLSEMELSNSLNAPQFADYCYDCWADKLHILNIADYGWCFYGGVHRSGLTNSVIENCMPGAGVLADASQPMKCQDMIIAHNVFYTSPGTTKGNVEAVYVVNNASAAENHSHIMVDGNIIYGGSNLSGGQKDSTGTYVALMTGVEDSHFVNNIVHDCASQAGLEIAGSRLRVDGNSFINVGRGPRTAMGIRLNGVVNSRITNNTFTDTQTIPTLQYGIGGVSGGYNRITDNNGAGAEKLLGFTAGPGDVCGTEMLVGTPEGG